MTAHDLTLAQPFFPAKNHSHKQLSLLYAHFFALTESARGNKVNLLPLPSMWKSWTALTDAAQELKSEHSAVTV